jgi:hypothetical protein
MNMEHGWNDAHTKKKDLLKEKPAAVPLAQRQPQMDWPGTGGFVW